MSYQILLAEDDRNLQEGIIDYCTGKWEELCFTSAWSGDEALKLAREGDFDLVLLDVMMPGLDGFQVCRAIRRTDEVPVIFITARTAEEDKLTGYSLGGDDYLVKPFLLSELLAKIRVLLRRSKGIGCDRSMTVGGIRLNTETRQVTVNGETIKLTHREYELLRCLMEHRGRPMTREALLDLVWGADYEGTDRSVDNHILKLRGKLGTEARQLVTIPKVGYQLGGKKP